MLQLCFSAGTPYKCSQWHFLDSKIISIYYMCMGTFSAHKKHSFVYMMARSVGIYMDLGYFFNPVCVLIYLTQKFHTMVESGERLPYYGESGITERR